MSEKERENPKAFEAHIEQMKNHHDRLTEIEKRLGIRHKADNMRSEDQKKGAQEPHYGRKRH